MNICYIQNPAKDYRRYGKGILFSNGCALNEVATHIFDMCNGKTTVDVMVDQLFWEYDCEKSILAADVNECLSYMLQNELICLL